MPHIPADEPIPIEEYRRRVEGSANASGVKARAAAWSLMLAARDTDNERATLESVFHLLEEMYRWKDAWAHSQVDKDHQVNDAIRRSESCAHHGEEIRDLKRQLFHADADRDRVEKARLILLGFHQATVDFVTGCRTRGVSGLPPAAKIVEWLEKSNEKVSAAHRRVFNANLPKPPPEAETKESTAS